MKIQTKIGLIVGLLAPLAASAQLVTPGTPFGPGDPGDAFHGITTDMSAAVGALGDGIHFNGSGSQNLDANPLHLSVEDSFVWTGSDFVGSPAAGQEFVALTDNVTHFLMTGDFSIGYFGNESYDDNELYMTADLDQTPGGEEWILNTVNNNGALFDYDGGDPNSPHDAPMSYNFVKGPDNEFENVYLQFVHFNRTQGDLGYQDAENQFKIFAEVDSGEFTGHYIMAIADRNDNFDGDRDDGFFYLQGDIVPVPEPSQIAALSVLGLGALLFVRRRIRKAAKK